MALGFSSSANRSIPLVKGFRRVLHVMPDDLSESALFRENIKRLGGTGLTFDLCVLPRQIDKAIALVDLAPGCPVHPRPLRRSGHQGRGFDEWRGKISDIAKRPNVTAKISGVVAYADAETWRVETLEPYVHHVIERFGWDRLSLGQRLARLYAWRGLGHLGRSNPCPAFRLQPG